MLKMDLEKGVLSVHRLTKGTLHTLQNLEETADRICESQESYSKQQHQLAILQKAVQTLRAKRDELKKDLRNTPWKVLRSSTLTEEDNGELLMSTGDVNLQSQDEILSAISATFKVKAQHILTHAYRLSGSSVKPVTKGKHKCVHICWDTFHEGHYCEPYYIELQRAKSNGKLAISRHSLPYFIPLTSLNQELNKDLAGFVRCVRNYLGAYVNRRQQVFKLQNNHTVMIDGEVHASASFDNMTFNLKLSNQNMPCTVAITLIYDDLLLIQPSRVDASIKDGSRLSCSASRKLCNKLKSLLTLHPIHVAVSKI